MKFKSTTVASVIFPGDFCDYKLKPNHYVTSYKKICIAAGN